MLLFWVLLLFAARLRPLQTVYCCGVHLTIITSLTHTRYKGSCLQQVRLRAKLCQLAFCLTIMLHECCCSQGAPRTNLWTLGLFNWRLLERNGFQLGLYIVSSFCRQILASTRKTCKVAEGFKYFIRCNMTENSRWCPPETLALFPCFLNSLFCCSTTNHLQWILVNGKSLQDRILRIMTSIHWMRAGLAA